MNEIDCPIEKSHRSGWSLFENGWLVISRNCGKFKFCRLFVKIPKVADYERERRSNYMQEKVQFSGKKEIKKKRKKR